MTGILPSYQRFVNGVPVPSISRRSFRLREKYLIVSVLLTFGIVWLGALFYLPEFKSSTSVNDSVYNVYKRIQKAGPELLMPPPLAQNELGDFPVAAHHGESVDGVDPHVAEDRNRLRAKIEEDMGMKVLERPQFEVAPSVSSSKGTSKRPVDALEEPVAGHNAASKDVSPSGPKAEGSDNQYAVVPLGPNADPDVKHKLGVVKENTDSFETDSLSSCELLNSEVTGDHSTKETYYVPSRTIGHKNTMPAKGKLEDRYYNQLRVLRTSGVLPQKRKHCAENSDSENEATNESHETDEQWLKVNRDPRPLVEEKNPCNSNAILTTMLNSTHRLMEIDFSYLYPERNLKLFEKWDDFQTKAKKLLENDVSLKQEMRTLLENDDENTRDLALCCLLPYKMKPTSKVMHSDKKRFNKVSIAECSEAFIVQVNNYADVEEALQKRHKSYNRKGLTCQPIIVCVGTPAALEAFYVAVDNIKYRFDSLTKALDICFKCMMVLNLAYPKECEQLWLFIQQYFYDIQLPSDKKFSQVATFINALEE